MRNDTAIPATDLCARGMLEQLDCRTLWDCGGATNSLLGRARATRKHERERKREKSSFQRFDSDGTFLPKVFGVQLLRMSLHWRLCATTL